MRVRKSLLGFAAALSMATAPASAQEAGQGEGEQALGQFRAAVAQMRALMLRAGEPVTGWDQGGADPDADTRAAGADRFYQLNTSVDGTGVAILTDRPIRDFAPAGWRVVDSYGTADEALDQPQVDFMPFSERYVMAARSRSWRQNDANCYRDLNHALLYEVPGAAAGADDATVPMMFRMMILALEGETICVRTDGDRQAGYRTRYFLSDGRPLPELTDANSLTTIVPAAPVAELIRAAPPRRTTTD